MNAARKNNPPNLLGVLTITIVLIVTLAGMALMIRRAQSASRQSIWQSAHDLPAYSILKATDLQRAKAAAFLDEALTDSASVIGRITKHPIAKGTALTASMLVETPESLQDWWLMPLPISSALAIKAGDRVMLVGIKPDTTMTTFSSERAVVLEIKDGQMIVALPKEQAQEAAAYLAKDHQLLVLGRLKP